MQQLSKTTETAFGLIAKAGEAKSYIFEAMFAAKEGRFDEASSLIEKADVLLTEAHQIQFKLLSDESSGANDVEVNFIMVHAQDHLMTTILAKELMMEIIENKKEIFELKEKK
ncbi:MULTISPECIES: PTS lactose/cellobiose transporter subunit IIA [unclassified Breznakia]|uniref:PTS lactose/cellobiose transporter subunit IIA n=1 Tax=unclassified Breznakia TaxID=2623764 RepID=UPI0024760D69|nr:MULTISPECIES: PTS lactose/cellobiose transporter subunit IIA [unclassified Breznakia]MDH6366695.1 cellobiose-specific phosphotransferase system component IIA [Breznakia sp. PH1-1]MDH6403788.1 cellobiose-specific phosphotransferase system component IIA [Breznakia sp. PF1-11]MDH6411497.1 cellobiose-specific phosphotransferase system component IIA [Breznakia sp. PFB1-11]MDH6413772.1 cellobiose-specific phosphotransferase system component IIA [Breznakia sp. PFB1-14]MDH6416202.1 cellobiose-speci